MADRPIVVNVDADVTGLKQGMSEATSELKKFEGDAADTGQQAGQRMGDELSDGVVERMGAAAGDIDQALGKWFGVEQLIEYGQQIVDGIIKGIESRQQAARDALDAAVTGDPEKQRDSALSALGGGNAAQGALAARRLGLSPADVQAIAAGQASVPGYAGPLSTFVAASRGAAEALPFGLGGAALSITGLEQSTDAQRALAAALDRNTAAMQAPTVQTYTGAGAGTPGAVVPSASMPSALFGVAGSASVPING